MTLSRGNSRKKYPFLALFLFLSLALAKEVKATAIYVPGETLNPTCLPSNPDCTVTSPITASGGETLTNKTIDGSTNTILNIGNSSLVNSEITITVGVGLSGGGTVPLGGTTNLALNLGASNVWTGLQTFNGGMAVGSSALVSNLNANYLNGISSTGFVGIGQTGNFVSVGQTGSLPYVNDVTNSSLTRSGAGPYTLALNLGSSNVWLGLQTFSGGIGVSGSSNFTNNMTVGGTLSTGTLTGIGSSFLVTNLNTNYLNSHPDSYFINIGQTGNFVSVGQTGGFVGVGQTGNFITTLTNGNGINITGSGTSRSIGVSSPTCTGTDKLQWNGSAFICSTDVGSSYTAGVGLTLSSSNVFALNLGSSNVWLGLQTFSGGIGVSGTVNLPTGSITNANLVNSAIGLSADSSSGSVSLGGMIKLNGSGATSITVSGSTFTINTPSSGSLTIRETDGSPSINPASAVEFGPATTSSDEFIVSDQTGGVARIRIGNKVVMVDVGQTLTNKTISGGSNTIMNIGNSSLTNSSLTVTAGVGLSGGGLVSLGGTTSLNLNLGASNVWTGLQTFNGGMAVGSSILVTNLNANYLNSHPDSYFINIGQTGNFVSVGQTGGFVGVGQTGNFITTLTNGNGINITGSGTSRSIGVSSPTCTGTDKLQWNGSAFICSTDVGSSYTAGVGLTLSSSNVFALNLGSSNVWLGLQTFSGGIGVSGVANFTNNLTVGGTFVSVGSTNLVSDLNANYLNGISSTGFVGIGQTGNFVSVGQTGGFVSVGQTGSLPYVNDVTNSSLTRNGTGPYTLALNLGSSNVWLGLQTFSGGIGVSGTVSLPTGSITNANLVNSAIGLSGNSGTGSVSLGGTLALTGSGITNISMSGSGVVITSTEADTLTSVIGRGATSASTVTLTSTANSLTAGTLVLNTDTITDLTGNGLSLSANALGINLTGVGTTGLTASNSGLEVSGSGLTLLKGCDDGQILKYTDAGGWACAADTSGGSPTLNTIVAANGANSINNGDNAQTWNWNLTTAAKTAFTFGENTAATGGSQYLVAISTLASSTAAPLKVSAQGNIILDTTNTGAITVGSTTANTAITLQSGTGTINLGTEAVAKTINIGTTTGATALNLISGTGGINIGTAAVNNIINIGSTFGGSTVNILSGTGGINIGNIAVGSTISIGIGGTRTLMIGSTSSNSSTTIQSGSGNISFAVGGNNSSGQVTIGNSGTTAPDLLVLDNGTSNSGSADPTGTNGAMYYNSSMNKFRCYENGAWANCISPNMLQTRSFGDTVPVTWTDNNTTELFTSTPRANITPSSTSTKILVVISVGVSTPGTGNDSAIGTIRRSIGGTATCDNTRTNKIDSFLGTYTTDPISYTATNTFLDNPSTTSPVYYTICTDSTSVMADTVTKISATISLVEVNNTTADLAEIYSTKDKTIGPGEVVSLDSSLKSGVKRSNKGYDPSVIGVVSAAPAITIGGIDDNVTSAVPVALSGRVPVKVNTESGAIKVGDPLTTSSTPGVAMKATKAGTIIGTAMSDFNGEGVGQILVFIKNGAGNGTRIADLLPGVEENTANYSTQILNQLMWQKNNLALTDLSEIVTDRLVAGLEIITPKITADKTQTKTLCVGDEDNETCINKTQLDQILSKMNVESIVATSTPTITPTPTGVGLTLSMP